MFEVVSPSEERSQRRRDAKRWDLMDADGVREIVEVVQDEFVCHVYRKAGDLSVFEAVDGLTRSSGWTASASGLRWRRCTPRCSRPMALGAPTRSGRGESRAVRRRHHL